MELEKCPNPRCKSREHISIDTTVSGGYFAQCEKCGVSGPVGIDREKAAHGWNALLREQLQPRHETPRSAPRSCDALEAERRKVATLVKASVDSWRCTLCGGSGWVQVGDGLANPPDRESCNFCSGTGIDLAVFPLAQAIGIESIDAAREIAKGAE